MSLLVWLAMSFDTSGRVMLQLDQGVTVQLSNSSSEALLKLSGSRLKDQTEGHRACDGFRRCSPHI